MTHDNEHDVIVVGAGPSGATAATALVQKGYDVLLLDRHSFPRDKVCGDAVSNNVISMLFDLGMADKVFAAEARGEFYRIDAMRLVSPSGYDVLLPFTGGEQGEETYVAPRIYFDAMIQQHAVDSGATFMQATVKEPVFDNGQVAGVRVQVNGDVKDIRSRVVVGAGGVTSPIMRALRPAPKQHNDGHRAVALRAYIEDLEILPHEVEFYLYDKILPGYAWIFPAGNKLANIGLGMRLDTFRKLKRNLKTMLQDFLDMPSLRERLQNGGVMRDVATWQLNFGSQKHLAHAFDGALLVGDAAGFIDPVTGGGIHSGIMSSLLAADTIDEALKKGDVSYRGLQPYEVGIREVLWRDMRRAYRYQQLVNNYPRAIDWMIGKLGKNSSLVNIFASKL